jgi:hypothetical protein
MMDMDKVDSEGWNVGTTKKTFINILDDSIVSYLFETDIGIFGVVILSLSKNNQVP